METNSNMLPTHSLDNGLYCGHTHIEVSGEMRVRLADTMVLFSDLLNVGAGKFRVVLGFASRNAFWMCSGAVSVATVVPSLFNRIRNIISSGAEKKMVGIYAQPIITSVKNAQPVRNFSICDNKGHAVGSYTLPIYHHLPVAIRVGCASPCPAAVAGSKFHTPPKSFNVLRCHAGNMN